MLRCRLGTATVCAFLWCIADQNEAADLTYTDTTPPLSIAGPLNGTQSGLDFDYSAMLPKFDQQLGTLISVEFETSFEITFNGFATGSAELLLPYQSSWDGMFTAMLPEDVFQFFNPSGSFNFSATQAATSGPIVDATVLAAVTGPGTGQFAFFDVGAFATVNDGLGTADVREGLLSITYTYAPAVPEPSALVIAFAGTVALFASRRPGKH